jgi:hypothetical protein
VGDGGCSEGSAEMLEPDLTCPKCGKTLGSRQAMRYHYASQNISPNEPQWDNGGIKLCRKIDKKEIQWLQLMPLGSELPISGAVFEKRLRNGILCSEESKSRLASETQALA